MQSSINSILNSILHRAARKIFSNKKNTVLLSYCLRRLYVAITKHLRLGAQWRKEVFGHNSRSPRAWQLHVLGFWWGPHAASEHGEKVEETWKRSHGEKKRNRKPREPQWVYNNQLLVTSLLFMEPHWSLLRADLTWSKRSLRALPPLNYITSETKPPQVLAEQGQITSEP